MVEKDDKHNPADFGLEARRAPADLKHVLADVEFLEYQRRDYLEAAMVAKVAELCRSPLGGRSVAQEARDESGAAAEPEAVPSVLLPGPHEIRHLEHLTGEQYGRAAEPEPEPECT